MTKIQETLVALPEEKKALFIPAFGDVDKFYTTVYLIARNEHVTELEKPDRYEDRLQVIRQIRGKVEKLVSSFGLDGSEIVADIASDYFEDYVNYKEPDIRMANEEFLGIIQKVARSFAFQFFTATASELELRQIQSVSEQHKQSDQDQCR